jgi:hypothetical protein
MLTSNDPEPPPGTFVRDALGTLWFNDGYYPCCWVQPYAEVHDPESWTKIAGNYGPVTVIPVDSDGLDQIGS